MDINVLINNLSIQDDQNQEILNIRTILNKLSNLKFNDQFNISNNGVEYPLGNDSKVLSKIYEIVIIDQLKKELIETGYDFIENEIQNKYPDFIIISKIQKDKYYAIDIKSTYIKNRNKINGFTLGTFNGYFKKRDQTKDIVKTYDSFIKHFCVCIIYRRDDNKIPVSNIIIREKWELASNIPGSGNTCNIGSIKTLDHILSNKTYFSDEKQFDQFWFNYCKQTKQIKN